MPAVFRCSYRVPTVSLSNFGLGCRVLLCFSVSDVVLTLCECVCARGDVCRAVYLARALLCLLCFAGCQCLSFFNAHLVFYGGYPQRTCHTSTRTQCANTHAPTHPHTHTHTCAHTHTPARAIHTYARRALTHMCRHARASSLLVASDSTCREKERE